MSTRPNILLLFTDQHRLSALGCYGPTPCQTPAIDRLAAAGTRFETAYTCCPVCTPTRASVMTGVHIHTHGMYTNAYNAGANVSELPDGPHLLSRKLRKAGYRCGYTGKWHLGNGGGLAHFTRQDAALPCTRGFEGQNFPGHGGGGFGYPEYKGYLKANGWTHEVKGPDRPNASGGILQGPVESTVPYFLASHTIDLIDRFAGDAEPFFIWHNNWGPHGPYFATQEYYNMYRDVEIPPWPNYEWPSQEINRPHRMKVHESQSEMEWEDWAESLRHYYAFTTMIDDQLKRILDHLEAKGLADNTLIIFTSDHGETLGTHGGLTDKGWHHFEETHRIGMIVKDPRQAGGQVRDEWASNLDVYPTILDAAGSDFDSASIHGRSLMPLVAGEHIDWRDTAVTEFGGVNSVATSMVTLRHGDLKYGWNAGNLDELYDLDQDPHEMTDLSEDAAYADQLLDMRKRMYTFMVKTRCPYVGVYTRDAFKATIKRAQPREDMLLPIKL